MTRPRARLLLLVGQIGITPSSLHGVTLSLTAASDSSRSRPAVVGQHWLVSHDSSLGSTRRFASRRRYLLDTVHHLNWNNPIHMECRSPTARALCHRCSENPIHSALMPLARHLVFEFPNASILPTHCHDAQLQGNRNPNNKRFLIIKLRSSVEWLGSRHSARYDQGGN